MYCAISGEVPQQPVVSAVSGHVFEQRLIEKALEASNGVCPATGAALDKKELIAVKADLAVRPRPLTATSVPGMLAMFQNEWDDVMLETHAMKQQLHATRKELSHALYQHDAACRVIARLVRERDEARAALAQVQAQAAAVGATAAVAASSPAAAMDVDATAPAGLPADVVAHMTEFWKRASKSRKKRPVPPGLAAPEDLRALKKADTSTKDSLFVDSAAATCEAVRTQGAVVSTLVGSATGGIALTTRPGPGKTVQAKSLVDVAHEGGVNALAFVPGTSLFLSGGKDGAKLWTLTEKGAGIKAVLPQPDGKAPVVGLTAHPTGEYAATGHADASLCLYTIRGKEPLLLADIADPEGVLPCSAIAFHPDGLILAAAVGQGVRIWDVKEQKCVHTFSGHGGAVNAIAFSENGYYMASAADDSSVRVWDLRKLSELKRLDADGPATAIAFDHHGKYLAHATDTSLVVDVVKEWTRLTTLAATSPVAVAFGPDAKSLHAAKAKAGLEIFE